jgi:hypothetical protein
VSTRDDEPGDRAAREAEEQAWREIVDGYGERPDVAGLIELTTPTPEPEGVDQPYLLDIDDESFTPPPLPPPPVISPERRLAWVGLVGSPALLALLHLLQYSVPGIITTGLIVACIASFGYLIATMEPRDPDDDGARV